ncbi:MAG: hypothetical protein M1834_009393 [Cirrosporium novae-zelandiae]|nr:MAG: hypothetical protein M1834_009393 [Cirrosporium novae-zelandiae]
MPDLDMEEAQPHSQDTPETPSNNVFVPPSVDEAQVVQGESYSYFSPIPKVIADDMSTECVLGIDEAGRGPVLGPMVYALFYLPLSSHSSMLSDEFHFADSKQLTPQVRSSLMRTLCTPDTPLYQSCGWAIRALSARDISSGMLAPRGPYNLNAQAQDATIQLIESVFALGINVQEVYIDTIGRPQTYQRMLEKIFPTTRITVAKKADSLYPCVSAASVCAKVTRDAALEVCYQALVATQPSPTAGLNRPTESKVTEEGWGSGYPSDEKCGRWLKNNKDELFGWGNECRFSWGTIKDILETKSKAGPTMVMVEWATPEDEDSSETMHLTDFFTATRGDADSSELSAWFGAHVDEEAF